jgi:hypothetical protein
VPFGYFPEAEPTVEGKTLTYAYRDFIFRLLSLSLNADNAVNIASRSCALWFLPRLFCKVQVGAIHETRHRAQHPLALSPIVSIPSGLRARKATVQPWDPDFIFSYRLTFYYISLEHSRISY